MTGSVASPFKQPKAVFAVTFAFVVSFMGIGLVDPARSSASGPGGAWANALFIATSLTVIVASASGGFTDAIAAGAIVVGIAICPPPTAC
jgi:MFS transporter, ACDE family, multidrug resistance protein